MQQTPAPGEYILRCCGDTLEFTLQLTAPAAGRAYLRTNIGHANTARQAIVNEILKRQPRLAEDWFDIPMIQINDRLFRLVLPLIEPGHFGAKAFFVPTRDPRPHWPAGPNTTINVHPALYSSANILYNAFVRQFGQEQQVDTQRAIYKTSVNALEQNGYAVIPPSGTFRDLIKQLDFIIHRLGCRIILLLPIHPTPTVYGRMGSYGSPYAALDFMDVDPALAEFDTKATPLEQFQELLDGIHARNARLFLDIAINHTGWAAKLHSQHPHWLMRAADGTIRSPGAWGVIWKDLTELNHAQEELWQYLAEVFLTWCRRGVDGFRCDAGYMIPLPAWEFIVATVRREFPDTVFLLEGLGGKIETTTALLNIANLNWAYSELFQNYERNQIETYLPGALQTSAGHGLLMHFAETHDNNRLAARSLAYAKMRTALAALCSSRGAFAFANGVEWLATAKIDVHQRVDLNWNNPLNQVDRITRLNAILRVHPAFGNNVRIRLIHSLERSAHAGNVNSIALLREHSRASLLVLINLDDAQRGTVAWNIKDAAAPAQGWIDLLSEKRVTATVSGQQALVALAPGEALCLSAHQDDLEPIHADEGARHALPEPLLRQSLRAVALEALSFYRGTSDISEVDADRLAQELMTDPHAFCQSLNPESNNLISWQWPRDLKRTVMLPPRHFLLISAPALFRVQVLEGSRVLRQADALPLGDLSSWNAPAPNNANMPDQRAAARFFVLLPPFPVPQDALDYKLCFSIYAKEKIDHSSAHLLLLTSGQQSSVPIKFSRHDLLDKHQILLGTNQRGGMLRAGVIWAELNSRYDALLAGNLSTEFPEDRRIMLTRCRAWLVYHGYAQDISLDREQEFIRDGNAGIWRFRVPFGHGQLVWFDVRAEMLAGKNAVRLHFSRRPCTRDDGLADDLPVALIIRPDIEDRSFHEDTKAYLGPEKAWPAAIQPKPNGFVFAPQQQHQLKMTATTGVFQVEPEWQYMVALPIEGERGLQAASDLFSPGYFRMELAGGEEAVVLAQILTPEEPESLVALPRQKILMPAAEPQPLLATLEQAMNQFIVRRGQLKTVIAGYPWFLDWGRDTLICARGLIAAGRLDDVGAILRQFAQFEKDGTLPNMIHGQDSDNRDTSDAPLWLITACADWCRAAGTQQLLEQPGDRRTLRQVLESIALGYQRGTPNGISMDPDSGLIFSPAHFTWMDTNFPAGSPREGYPIEIQALWHAALSFLYQISAEKRWAQLAERVKDSILRYYWNPQRGYLADCLHAPHAQPAAKTIPYDALRPNQLLALTLGAVTDLAVGRNILTACSELLVPGAIRSLADRPVEFPLPIQRDGRLLNDPLRPYWGRYEGDEDTRRKPAYHNGTAWTWLFPSFPEAWLQVYGPPGEEAALAWLSSSLRLINAGCLGQIPEILDGDYPHRQRGCDAQAWGVTELYRVLKKISLNRKRSTGARCSSRG